MSRNPCSIAMALVLVLVMGAILDAIGGGEIVLDRASGQGTRENEVRIMLGEEGKITAKPRTISLREQLTPQLRSQIAEAMKHYPEATVRLTIGGVIPPADRDSIHGFRIFLNKPDAKAATPIDDPHYVRSIEFEPTTDSAPQAFAFDVLRTLVKLDKIGKIDVLNPKTPLNVTIVVVPSEELSRNPEDVYFTARELTLCVPKRP